MMRCTALCLALVAPLAIAGCVDEPIDTTAAPVIGGTLTPDGEFPAVGALIYNFGGTLFAGCTGTLVAPDVVLTAAHCLDPNVTGGPLPTGFTFKHDTTGSVQPMLAVASVYKHEQFDIQGGSGDQPLMQWFDIGLVMLAAPVTDVEPMKMPTPTQKELLIAGTDLELVGYGQTTDENANSTGVMFNAATKAIEVIDSEMRVSMGTPDPQNCHGDSGGPALAMIGGQQRVVGIVSRSYVSQRCDNGGVDTRVDAYLPWIVDHIPATSIIPCGSGMSAPCENENEDDDDGGCCSTGNPGQASIGLGVMVGALMLRRRRRAA